MKLIKFTLITFFVFVINLQAQQFRSIVLKTNNNSKFIAYVNQEQINRRPMSEIVITNLIDNYYNVIIETVSNKQQKYNLYAAPNSEIIYVLNTNYSSPKSSYFIEDIYPLPSSNSSNSFGWHQNNGNVNNGLGQINININNQMNTQQNNDIVAPIIEEVVYLEGYNGDIGCEPPVNNTRFRSMLATIEKQNFASSKKRIAKQIISSNCILTDNLVQIIDLFDFESDKLSVAKFAYDYTYDIENYYKINNVFDFESSIEELDKYIRGK
jgi:hypothetical protein